MLQIIFGDDEHTAADGPYARLLKTRKWLYLTSIASITVAYGLYDQQAAREVIKIVSIPQDILASALLIGLSYLTLQYSLLAVQLIATYDIILTERFTFRRADELTKARERAKDSYKLYGDAIAEFRKHSKNALSSYVSRLESEKEEIQRGRMGAAQKLSELHDSETEGVRELRYVISRSGPQIALLQSRIEEVSSDPDTASSRIDPLDDHDVNEAHTALMEAEHDLLYLQRQVPSERVAYRATEKIIDFARMAPPLGLAFYALYCLLS